MNSFFFGEILQKIEFTKMAEAISTETLETYRLLENTRAEYYWKFLDFCWDKFHSSLGFYYISRNCCFEWQHVKAFLVKTLLRKFIFNEVVGLEPATLLKKNFDTGVFRKIV